MCVCLHVCVCVRDRTHLEGNAKDTSIHNALSNLRRDDYFYNYAQNKCQPLYPIRNES